MSRIEELKAKAQTAIDARSDWLVNAASKAGEVLAKSPARMTKKQYLDLQDQRLTEEIYEGK